MMAPLKERFDALQSSEQRAVTILGVFAVVVVIYLGVWAPASDWRVIAEQERDSQFETLSMMKETESQARAAARERPAETAEGSLLSLFHHQHRHRASILIAFSPREKTP